MATTAGGDGCCRATGAHPLGTVLGCRPWRLFGPDALRETIIAFRDAMQVHAAAINRLNVYPVPDGDTGTNMARTLEAVVESLSDGGRPNWTRRARRSATAA